jgi:hypothetical protein
LEKLKSLPSLGFELLMISFGSFDYDPYGTQMTGAWHRDPRELSPLLAESGRCGLSPVAEPVPDANLAGAVRPKCDDDA